MGTILSCRSKHIIYTHSILESGIKPEWLNQSRGIQSNQSSNQPLVKNRNCSIQSNYPICSHPNILSPPIYTNPTNRIPSNQSRSIGNAIHSNPIDTATIPISTIHRNSRPMTWSPITPNIDNQVVVTWICMRISYNPRQETGSLTADYVFWSCLELQTWCAQHLVTNEKLSTCQFNSAVSRVLCSNC